MKFRRIKAIILCALVPTLTLTSCQDFFSEVGNTISETFNDFIEWGTGAYTYVASGTMWSDIVEFTTSTYENAKDWAVSFGKKVGDVYTATKDGIVGFFAIVGEHKLEIDRREHYISGLEDYIGDPQTISIGLLNRYLSLKYTTFYGTVTYNDVEYDGLCYTDTESIYTATVEGETKIFQGAGFISLDEENILPEEARNEVTYIQPICDDEVDEGVNYYIEYETEPFTTHLISNNKYIQYGVDSTETLRYHSEDYTGNYETELGGLYSFDQDKFIYGNSNSYIVTKDVADEVNNANITYSLWDSIKNGFGVTLKSISNFFKDAKSYILSFLETISGSNVWSMNISQIRNRINNTSESDVISTNDNVTSINAASSSTSQTYDTITKWMMGIATLLLFATNILVQFAAPFFPIAGNALKLVVGSVFSVFMYLFFGYILSNVSLSSINWYKVLIVAIAGGISAFTGIVADSFIGGVTDSVFSLMDGNSIYQGALDFVNGFVAALCISSIVKGIASVITKMVGKVAYKVKVRNISKKLQNLYGDLNMSDEVAIDTAAAKVAQNSINDSVASSFGKNSDEYQKMLTRCLPSDNNSNVGIFNSDGVRVSKNTVLSDLSKEYTIKLLSSSSDELAERWAKVLGSTDKVIKIINGQIDFEPISYAKVTLSSDDLTPDRSTNFRIFEDALAKQWNADPSSIPEEYYNYFKSIGVDPDFDDIKPQDIQNLKQHFGLTIHECADRVTMLLVDGLIHAKISHFGGISVTKYLISKSEDLFMKVLKGMNYAV